MIENRQFDVTFNEDEAFDVSFDEGDESFDVSFGADVEREYHGATEVVPSSGVQTLPTANRMLTEDVVINGLTYSNCPEVDIPKSGSGTAKFYDTSGADAAAGDILTGKTAYNASGSVNGSMANNGSTGGTIGTKAGTVTIPAGYTSGGTVSLTNVSDCVASSILSGKSILGVSGSLSMPTISQDSTTKILSIS